jgi:sporulation protein YunB
MKHKIKLPKKWIIILILLVLLACYMVIDSMVRPAIVSLAESKLKAIAVTAMNDAVRKSIGGSGVNYSDLMDIEKDGDGNISIINANTVLLNELATETATAAQNNILNAGQQGINIPLGTVFGGPLLTGRGPAIIVKFEPAGSVTTDIKDELDAAGINQTSHRIYFILNASIRIIVGNISQTVEVSSQVLISETIIVGKVPQTYLQFSGSSSGLLNLLPNNETTQ